MTHLSQDNEAEIISNFFGDHVGHFIDIGASGGVSLSNTFQLGLKNWKGVLVEASPIHFQNLASNYLHRGGFRLVNAAFWHERRVMEFHLNPFLYSSLIHKDEPNLYVSSYYVPTVIAEDLKAIQPECDLLSLDIESADIIVFPSLMDAYPHCKLCVVEHAKDEALKVKWHEMFERYKLHVIGETPENFLAAR